MHEFSITSQIVREVLKEAANRGAKKILEVHLVIGDLTLLGIEQVRFSYGILVENTAMEGSRLFIQRKKGRVRCDRCGYKGPMKIEKDLVYHIAFPTLACPKCGSLTKIVEGKECLIRNIKLAVE